MQIRTNDWQIRIIQLLSVAGMFVAYYLCLFHKAAVFPACGVNEFFDCGQVSGPASPYSAIQGIPVALIGLIGYITIFLLTWLKDWLPIVEENMAELMIGVLSLGFAFTAFLTLQEMFVIHAFCQYCLVSAAIITVMFILAVSYLLASRRAPAG